MFSFKKIFKIKGVMSSSEIVDALHRICDALKDMEKVLENVEQAVRGIKDELGNVDNRGEIEEIKNVLTELVALEREKKRLKTYH